jgi:acetate kinase
MRRYEVNRRNPPELPPEKIILSINAGSSSVKLTLYSASRHDVYPKPILSSSISNLTSPPAVFSYTHAWDPSRATNVESDELPDVTSHDDAFKYFLEYLSNDSKLKEVNGGEDIAFACHRVVHGGGYEKAVVIGEGTLHYLKELTDLAPL